MKKRNKINNNIIMLTIMVIFILSVLFIGSMRLVKADEQIQYDKNFISIEIESGDTLTSIAKEYAISEAEYHSYIEEVKSINSIKNDTIHSGCYLLIPVYTEI